MTERWMDNVAARAQLGDRFVFTSSGWIYPRIGTVPTEDDESAIDYLFLEWDYMYTPCNKGSSGAPCGKDRCAFCGRDAP